MKILHSFIFYFYCLICIFFNFCILLAYMIFILLKPSKLLKLLGHFSLGPPSISTGTHPLEWCHKPGSDVMTLWCQSPFYVYLEVPIYSVRLTPSKAYSLEDMGRLSHGSFSEQPHVSWFPLFAGSFSEKEDRKQTAACVLVLTDHQRTHGKGFPMHPLVRRITLLSKGFGGQPPHKSSRELGQLKERALVQSPPATSVTPCKSQGGWRIGHILSPPVYRR